MLVGRVIGNVWASKKSKKLENLKLLIVKPYFWYNPPHNVDHIVVVDNVGACIGEDVLVSMGAPGRWNLKDENIPIEAAVMGIVDQIEITLGKD